MKDILIIGSGGREHALALAFARSPQVQQVYVAPGNPGMVMTNHNIECVNIPVTEIERLAEFVESSAIDLTFVGPEQPLEWNPSSCRYSRHSCCLRSSSI